MYKKNTLFLVFFLMSYLLFGQLTIIVTSLPSNTPANESIHLAGNFNGWDPGDAAYILENNNDGTYQIEISPNPGLLEYKFTRGSWITVEGNESGGFRPNRQFQYDGSATLEEVVIVGWEDVGGGNSTAAENVQVYNESFYIPQLNRNRRIWVYLPPDYDDSGKNYPVLYMHDGQNLFDAETSFAGEWEVDETLNELHANGDWGIIVVGIDNGGSHRIDEYSPWVHPDYGGGEGEAYVDFIVESLKPHIDQNFRTLPEREYTGIMGSSLGGLISHYAAIEHQDVFSRAGIFSPSYWFSSAVFTHLENTGHLEEMKLYTIVSQNEGPEMVAGVNDMNDLLFQVAFTEDELFKKVHSDGAHSEWYWAREFGAAYEWLFGDLELTSFIEIEKRKRINVFPNPTNSIIQFEGLENYEQLTISLFSSDGSCIYKKPFNGHIQLDAFPKGTYLIEISANGQDVFSDKIVLR